MQKYGANEFFSGLFIMRASAEEVRRMSASHYRSLGRQPYTAAWKITHKTLSDSFFRTCPIGIITYAMPLLNAAARRQAAGDFFSIPDKRLRLKRLNGCVRRISRVIIDSRFRGLGLAAWLVRETMPWLNVPMIETVSVMGRMARFFERAGMRKIELPPRPPTIHLAELLVQLGIPEDLWTDALEVYARIQTLPRPSQTLLEQVIRRFLGPYGRRRQMPEGLARIRFVLSHLNARPAYFFWFHPEIPLTR